MTLKEKVFRIMAQDPECRDNIYKLALEVAYRDMRTGRIDMPLDLMSDIIKGKIPFLNVDRYRRLVEEEYPELRGQAYKKRQLKVKKVQSDLRKAKKERPERIKLW